MGELYNSNASIVYQIINWIGIIAGTGCVAMILMSVIAIATGDESAHSRFLKRIKNGIIALILIISVTQITNLTTQYFSVDSKAGIGDFSEYVSASADQGIAEIITEDRNMILFEGNIYVEYKSGKKLDFNKGAGKYQIYVSIYKNYSDCQGVTKGAWASEQFYIFYDRCGNKMSETVRDKYKGYLFSAESFKNYDIEDDEDFESFMENYGVPYGTYTWFDSENNPYGGTSGGNNGGGSFGDNGSMGSR